MNEQLNAVFTWIAQAVGAGVAAGFAMIAAGGDLTQKSTWAAIGVTIVSTAWSHLRDSPFPSTTGAPKA